MNRLRLEFVTAIFVNEMRKQAITIKPDQPVEIGRLEDYPAAQRSALMAAIEKAIQYSQPATDATFAAWQEKREAERQQEPAAYQ